MTIEVIDTEYGFEISWDPSDPVECVLNDWTEQDFLQIMLQKAKKVLAEHKIAQNSLDQNTFEQEFMAK